MPRDKIDRAVLLLTLGPGSHAAVSNLSLYGVADAVVLGSDWQETGPERLRWDDSPSKAGLKQLKLLAQTRIDNAGNALVDVADGVRIHGPELDKFLRSMGDDQVTLILVRNNVAPKPTRFHSKEGKPEQAPGLALRPQGRG